MTHFQFPKKENEAENKPYPFIMVKNIWRGPFSRTRVAVGPYCSSFYCCHLWSNSSADSRNRMKVAHNRIFRVSMNLEHRVIILHNFILHNVHHSNIIVRNCINGFMDRICMSSNLLLVTILNSNFYNDCMLSKYWCNTLYTNT